MSILAEGLQPSVLPGLFKAAGRLPVLRMSDVLTAKGAAYDLNFSTGTNNTIHSDFRDTAYVSDVVAADCSRLAVASLQSIIEATRLTGDKFAVPWSIIQAYYAAFYAAHAIVRILGGGCCWLESQHTDRIRNSASVIGVALPFRVEPGNYRCAVSPSGTSFEWTRMTSGKGTHESFWSYFESFVRTKAAAVLAGPISPQDGQAAFAQLTALLDFSVVRRSPYWMSRIRNEVQYQFEHGVWHATVLSAPDRNAISKLVASWDRDPMEINLNSGSRLGDLGDLSVSAAFLVALCRVLMARVAERGAGKTRSFVYFGPSVFLNHRQRH